VEGKKAMRCASVLLAVIGSLLASAYSLQAKDPPPSSPWSSVRTPEGEPRRRAMAGAQLAPVTREVRDRQKLEEDDGVAIATVFPGTSAAPPAAADTPLTPGQVIQFTFPKLPRTLRAMNTPGASGPTSISVRLPDNYSRDRAFPLFVFLHGGQGSLGSEVGLPTDIVGKNDYVVATFPLFKKEINREEQWGGVGIDFLDYPTLSGAYQAFLERIRKTIPNLDAQASVLGGYSNGGNALGVLLSALDPTTLKSFKRFFFIDSGVDWTGYARYKSLGDHDILFVVGGGTAAPEWSRPAMLSRVAYFKEVAQRYGASRWEFIVVDGASHGDLARYFPYVKRWAAGKANASKVSGEQAH
jgi:hypothetical protein